MSGKRSKSPQLTSQAKRPHRAQNETRGSTTTDAVTIDTSIPEILDALIQTIMKSVTEKEIKPFIPRISEVLYVTMCNMGAAPTLVSTRREVVNIEEIIKMSVAGITGKEMRLSGSRKEGFGNFASDFDYMFWPTNHHVIWDLNHADEFNTESCTLILMENFNERPGFTMLQLLTPSDFPSVNQSCIEISSGLYISSSKYRENTLYFISADCFQHGPCASTTGEFDYDYAHCFACRYWPSMAKSFTQRSQSRGWPNNHILKGIIKAGCHVVPIGFKGSPQEDCEWRISFSVAELKLIYCMNHTQFLCYGLLKYFLKEALTVKDTNGQPLLCSYFMKTILFWVIQNNTLIDWNPSSLLPGFWLCLKFLLSCVYHTYLPNFFIPENNMFITKVYGHSRQIIYEQLLKMYQEGIKCLLRCQSLRECLAQAIYYRQCEPIASTAESTIIPEYRIDRNLFNEIIVNDFYDGFCSNPTICFIALDSAVGYLLTPNLNRRQRAIIKKYTSSILRFTIFYLHNASKNLKNKEKLKTLYACLNLFKISGNLGFLSDRIYMVLFLYSIGKNRDAIRNLNEIKTIITDHHTMLINSSLRDQLKPAQELVGWTLEEKMKRLAPFIRLQSFMIEELELEYKVARSSLNVPADIMTLMLLVLCHRKNPQKQQEALCELITEFIYNKECILENQRDISWQILGICQQICGDHQGALLSYQTSLKEMPMHKIQEATFDRMRDAQYKILCSSVRQ